MISGIGWVSELVEAAGGIEAFLELARPDIVIGSLCGKKFRPELFAARPGFDALPAVRDGFLREVKSSLILQPGPAALTEGLEAIAAIVEEWRRIHRSRP